MDETTKIEGHLSSAAAFVEGGIQEACDDACSICLEAFSDSDPSTVTGCKHEFHLQCILEWCQRSSQCPMCWQAISLKDPTSQELLEAVEHERSFRLNQSRNTAIFHHPALGDFELQHLPLGRSDAELEERIIQHLAAAAAMGRARRIARREGHRRLGAQGRQQVLVFQAHPTATSTSLLSAVSADRGDAPAGLSARLSEGEESSHQATHNAPVEVLSSTFPSNVPSTNGPGPSSNWNPASQPTAASQERVGPSDLQSLSESIKSRFNAVSLRCKESITRNTRGWRERFFSRSSSISDIGSDDRTAAHAGITSVSHMVEDPDPREDNIAHSPLPQGVEGIPGTPGDRTGQTEVHSDGSHAAAGSAARSGSN
ncbi:unnamed protein product [Spirodela intermedia]|uniref:RING-type E3 ubiquitin transferase n=2 Tax=Spirodela intermedia TaxID=51605 RepID=A0A7I8KNP0_SPIIN|nr:unnamed protein product [Spirodela intermedia]CAA6662831.1 unnamed protein product [Spirodela intermedia]CAA7399241.1 unnamed protein product [Spirodela intermedia]